MGDHHRKHVGPALNGFVDERQHWRERTLQGLMGTTFVTICVAAIWSASMPAGMPHWLGVVHPAAISMGGLLLARPFLPFNVRAIAFLVIVYGACLGSTLLTGFNPNAMAGYTTVAVAAALLFGLVAAIFVVLLDSFALLAVSFLHASGLVQHVPNWSALIDSARIANGERVAGIFALLSASSVIGVSYLLKRSEDLVVQQSRAFQALEADRLEKERLRRDLELREVALGKARELETLGRLAGSMAHDFNNALFVIWVALDELTERGDQPAVREAALAALRTAADQAAATTRSLRAFGPLAPRRPTLLRLSALLSRAKSSLCRVLPPNVVLETEVQVESTVVMDEGELLRVLTNLALNARDAMREGGKLTLRVRSLTSQERAQAEGMERVALEVEDTGTGISDDVMQHLFEPFFTTKELGGTGLGLTSVREVVRAHGGDIVIASTLGRGTTVTLFLPTVEGVAGSLQRRDLAASGTGAVVLLVEDDPTVLAAMSRSLANHDFVVVEAATTSLAFEKLRRGSQRIDVLCTDWMLPGRPARELIAEFRRLHRGHVLICSAHAPGNSGVLLDRASDFLPKPFSGEELARRISQLVAAPPLPPFPDIRRDSLSDLSGSRATEMGVRASEATEQSS
jgi:signal transduction histidine kinase